LNSQNFTHTKPYRKLTYSKSMTSQMVFTFYMLVTNQVRTVVSYLLDQATQLMLTNARDAFRGQSRSPNIVPFHMLGTLSSCAIVTLSLRRAFAPFPDIRLQECRDLEIRVRGNSRSLKMVPFDRLCMSSYI